MSICDKCGRESECPVAHEDDFCLNYVQKPQTNADRIRQMTEEELAVFITCTDFCELLCNDGSCKDGQCDVKLLEWLKQEVKK